jgi:hypothetical protein
MRGVCQRMTSNSGGIFEGSLINFAIHWIGESALPRHRKLVSCHCCHDEQVMRLPVPSLKSMSPEAAQ